MIDQPTGFTLEIKADDAAYAEALAELAQQWQAELNEIFDVVSPIAPNVPEHNKSGVDLLGTGLVVDPSDPVIQFAVQCAAGVAAPIALEKLTKFGQWVKQSQREARQRLGNSATVQLTTAQGRVLVDVAKLSAQELTQRLVEAVGK